MRIHNRRISIAVALVLLLTATQVLAGRVELEAEGHLAFKTNMEAQRSSFALMFDLSEIPKDANVDLAELMITVDVDSTMGKYANVLVYAATDSWTPSAFSSTTEPTAYDTLYVNNFLQTTGETAVEINVTGLVQMWHSGKLDNNGFLVAVHNNTEMQFSLRGQTGSWQATLKVFYSK